MKRSYSFLLPFIPLAVSWLLTPNAKSESEPGDDLVAGASTISINGPAATGFVDYPDIDHYKFTYNGGYTEVRIRLHFEGTPADTRRLEVVADGVVFGVSTTTSTTPGPYLYVAEIALPTEGGGTPLIKGHTYTISTSAIFNFSTGSLPYTITVTGTGAPDLAAINELKKEIRKIKQAVRKADDRVRKAGLKAKLRRLIARLKRLQN